MDNEKTYVLYDELYFGKGYLIINEKNNEIIKYIKITVKNEFGLPHFLIRGYEKGVYDEDNQIFRELTIQIREYENPELYRILEKLSLEIAHEKISTIDESNQGKNYFDVKLENNENDLEYNAAILTLYKDIYGVKNATDFIDIDLGDNDTCLFYSAVYGFYSDLGQMVKRSTNEKDIKKLLRKKD